MVIFLGFVALWIGAAFVFPDADFGVVFLSTLIWFGMVLPGVCHVLDYLEDQ